MNKGLCPLSHLHITTRADSFWWNRDPVTISIPIGDSRGAHYHRLDCLRHAIVIIEDRQGRTWTPDYDTPGYVEENP